MRRSRLWPGIAACLAGLVLAPGRTDAADAQDGPAAERPDPGRELFEPTRVYEFRLTLGAAEFERMQPAAAPPFGGPPFGPPGFGGPPGGGPPPAADREPPAAVHKKNTFGTEFPWARGELTFEGETARNVGVRYKGNFTYGASGGGLKRPLKLDFDHFDDAGRFRGLKKLNLNSGVTDPARVREATAFALFREAGVPAPRTAYVELSLTVPGKYENEHVGLYTLVEQVDGDFLKSRFGSSKGLLLKPEGIRGLPHYGDDWQRYAEGYVPKDDADERQRRRLIEFTRLVNEADDAAFRREIGSYLDVDQFLRFLAANALAANLDSFLGFGHNYYLYLRPDDDRFVFIPWDVDLSFGTWPVGGPPERQAELSLTHPHPGENNLIDRLLADPEAAARYRAVLKELAASCFDQGRLRERIDRLEAATKEPLAREKSAVAARNESPAGFPFGPPGGDMFGRSMSLREFLEKRTASVAAQLAGTSEGYVPAAWPGPGGFGPGFGPPGAGPPGFGPPGFGPPGFGPPGGMSQPGVVLSPFLQNVLKLDEEQKRRIEALQGEVDRQLLEVLTDEQKRQFEGLRGGRPPGPPPVRPSEAR